MQALMYRLYLWWHIPNFGFINAMKYPYELDTLKEEGAFEAARIEMSYMNE